MASRLEMFIEMLFAGTPEEFNRAVEKANMEAEVTRSRVFRFLDESSKEDLLAVLNMLQNCTGEEGSNTATYFIGQIVAILRTKHNMCSCGKEHTAAEHIAEMAAEEDEHKPDTEGDNETRDNTAALNEYNVEYVDDGPRVRCKGTTRIGSMYGEVNCNMTWPSLDDRMMMARCGNCGAGPVTHKQ